LSFLNGEIGLASFESLGCEQFEKKKKKEVLLEIISWLTLFINFNSISNFS